MRVDGQTNPSMTTASCSSPPTLMRIGDEYTLPKSFLAHATLPSACWNAINDLPRPPTGTMIVSRKAIGLDA